MEGLGWFLQLREPVWLVWLARVLFVKREIVQFGLEAPDECDDVHG